jgi:type IV pilus assembly protein PilN
MTTTTTNTGITTHAGFTQVNLLPPENKERQAARRKTRIVAVVGGAVVALLVLFFLVQSHKVSDLESKVSAQNSANAALQAQVTKLQPYEDLRTSMIQRQSLEKTAMSGEVHWSSQLHELSRILPPSVWLTSIAGTTAAASTAETTTTTTGQNPVVGSMTFQCSSLDTNGLVQWLQALDSVHGWANAWVSSATKSAIGSTNVWQCASSVDLTHNALAAGGAK